MKRDLFVFAGQSNMMGASVYPPKNKILTQNSFEYKHKARRLGNPVGDFVSVGRQTGEFSYADMGLAYAPNMVNENGESLLNDYAQNAFFCPSMYSLKSDQDKTEFPFATFSEATAPAGATLAPLLAQEWERRGGSCAYAHIAKGGVKISHFMTDKMAEEYKKRITEYNRKQGTEYESSLSARMEGAADYFFEKCRDFLTDAEKKFPEDCLDSRCFFWLQGESDAKDSSIEYEMKLEILWNELKTVGFTHFFCIRVDYFGNDLIHNVMLAQENFTAKHSDAYMMTRSASFFSYAGRDEAEWFSCDSYEEYKNCRDSFYGYKNQHINEKGFLVIASHTADNLFCVLVENQDPLLETENIRMLK